MLDARITDVACSDSEQLFPQGYPNYFSPRHSALQMLGAYGLAGDVAIPTYDDYGKQVLLSLVRPEGGVQVRPRNVVYDAQS